MAKLITNGQYVYKAFLEIFLEICSQIVENIDLKSVLGFMDLLWQRIINESVVGSKGNWWGIQMKSRLCQWR